MVMSVASPRRSIRDSVFQRLRSYYGTASGKRRKGWSFYGERGGGGVDREEEPEAEAPAAGGPGFWMEEDQEDTELVQLGAERTKNVLILMSDTGGGHRASAEAIREAFHLEFGDDYRVRIFLNFFPLYVV